MGEHVDNSWNLLMQQVEQIFRFLSEPIFQLSDAKISVISVLVSIFVILISIRLAQMIGRFVNNSLHRRGVDSGVRDSIEKFVRYGLIALGIMFSLDNLGISFNSLAALGAVLMVGVGFGLQNITQNFISGIILLIERPVKVGDIVQVGHSEGKIIDIRVRATLIQTRDDITIIVPNSKFVSEEVVNDSYTGEKIRQHVSVGVAYGSDVQKVIRILKEVVEAHPKVLQDPKPMVLFQDFGDSSLDFDLRFWGTDIWGKDITASDIRTEIDRRFREEGVEIPFPQRDVHFKNALITTSKSQPPLSERI
ncbi:MAG: transporter [Bdellovibrionaceae bacterium]|nr:transporter [Pseudobdellovibrionaceae bacterium]